MRSLRNRRENNNNNSGSNDGSSSSSSSSNAEGGGGGGGVGASKKKKENSSKKSFDNSDENSSDTSDDNSDGGDGESNLLWEAERTALRGEKTQTGKDGSSDGDDISTVCQLCYKPLVPAESSGYSQSESSKPVKSVMEQRQLTVVVVILNMR